MVEKGVPSINFGSFDEHKKPLSDWDVSFPPSVPPKKHAWNEMRWRRRKIGLGEKKNKFRWGIFLDSTAALLFHPLWPLIRKRLIKTLHRSITGWFNINMFQSRDPSFIYNDPLQKDHPVFIHFLEDWRRLRKLQRDCRPDVEPNNGIDSMKGVRPSEGSFQSYPANPLSNWQTPRLDKHWIELICREDDQICAISAG